MTVTERAPPVRVAAAFAAVYFLWGANFLAIRYAVEAIPPFLLMGVRSALAGLCLYAWARLRGAGRPTAQHWRSGLLVGGLLFLGCHGLLAWAQRRVPSGVAALLMATLPVWMVLLDWWVAGARRPGARVWAGLLLGLFGLGVLVGPRGLGGGASLDLLGALALLLSAFAWAAGSIAARLVPLPSAVVLATGMELLAGGALLGLVAALTGEAGGFVVWHVPARAVFGFAYMVVASSLLGFTAFVWLLRVSTPTRVASYAFVNPLVAVLLGWAVGGEALTARLGVAAALIVAGVAAIVSGRDR
jgi:drug/metabolite transporter (DMT)-like permease